MAGVIFVKRGCQGIILGPGAEGLSTGIEFDVQEGTQQIPLKKPWKFAMFLRLKPYLSGGGSQSDETVKSENAMASGMEKVLQGEVNPLGILILSFMNEKGGSENCNEQIGPRGSRSFSVPAVEPDVSPGVREFGVAGNREPGRIRGRRRRVKPSPVDPY